MPDASAIAAYVSAGVALTVGVASPFMSNHNAERRLRQQLTHDLEMRERDERIALLDSVAQALTRMQRSTDEVLELWRDGVPATDARVREAIDRYWDHLEELRQVRARLAMRYTDDSKIFASFDQAQHWQQEYRGQVDLYQQGAAFDQERWSAVRREAVSSRRAWLGVAREILNRAST